MGMKPTDILGVHTGGKASLKKNWTTYITPAKLEWIANTLGSPWTVSKDYGTLSLGKNVFGLIAGVFSKLASAISPQEN